MQHIVPRCMFGWADGIWTDRVYAAPVPVIPGFELKIVHLEMINIVVAMRLWYWKNSKVIIYCDNEACVQVVTTSKARDKSLAACVRNLWLITATYDISLQVQHSRGK